MAGPDTFETIAGSWERRSGDLAVLALTIRADGGGTLTVGTPSGPAAGLAIGSGGYSLDEGMFLRVDDGVELRSWTIASLQGDTLTIRQEGRSATFRRVAMDATVDK